MQQCNPYSTTKKFPHQIRSLGSRKFVTFPLHLSLKIHCVTVWNALLRPSMLHILLCINNISIQEVKIIEKEKYVFICACGRSTPKTRLLSRRDLLSSRARSSLSLAHQSFKFSPGFSCVRMLAVFTYVFLCVIL